MPVVTARATLAATPSGATANPPSKSALTGTLDRAGDRLEMRQRLVEGHRRVGLAQGPGEPGTRRRECREPDHLEVAGAADVPRVGDDEAAGFVERAEGRDAVGHVPDDTRNAPSRMRISPSTTPR